MNSTTLNDIETPFFVVYEENIRRNLDLISHVGKEAGVSIIMAFKANAMWRLFPLLREYGFGFAASSVNELRLGYEELGVRGHTYCLAYKPLDMPLICRESSHLTFNSLSQWAAHKDFVERFNSHCGTHKVSPGLRVNPHCDIVETDIYNPAKPGSRFGVGRHLLDTLPAGIEGLHFHQLCESTSFDLEKVLATFERDFGHLLPALKWVNMGGGHLMTRRGYDTEHLIGLLRAFRNRYPWLEVILEPGSAFMWRTGNLIVSVMDIVEDAGVKTAIIDGSFTCHMPDTLEMPYLPAISESCTQACGPHKYTIGGNSCLSGDFKSEWFFDKPLEPGQRLTFEDMNHYTNVKTTMFNGLHHPSIVYVKTNGSVELLREYDFEDYKSRMS